MTTTTRFVVDHLIEIPAQHIAVMEILKGTFDDEIKRVTELRDELKARQEVDQTLEKATALHAEAKQKADAADKLLADTKFQTQQTFDSARSTMESALAQAKQVSNDAAKIVLDRSVFEAERQNEKELLDQRSAALDLRESQLAAMAGKLGEEQRKLAVEREAFNAKLEALRV